MTNLLPTRRYGIFLAQRSSRTARTVHERRRAASGMVTHRGSGTVRDCVDRVVAVEMETPMTKFESCPGSQILLLHQLFTGDCFSLLFRWWPTVIKILCLPKMLSGANAFKISDLVITKNRNGGWGWQYSSADGLGAKLSWAHPRAFVVNKMGRTERSCAEFDIESSADKLSDRTLLFCGGA
jgi:hypothetical protein